MAAQTLDDETEGVQMPDAEIEAMGEVADALGGLEEDERGRVLRWAAERYGITIPRTRNGKVDEDDRDGDVEAIHEDENRAGSDRGEKSEPDHFAELDDATDPKTDAERVLVASYWTQVNRGKTMFGSQELNKMLKDLGHGVGTINKAMSANINKKPALILHVARGGSTQQARKKYKLTEAGKKWIVARLA